MAGCKAGCAQGTEPMRTSVIVADARFKGLFWWCPPLVRSAHPQELLINSKRVGLEAMQGCRAFPRPACSASHMRHRRHTTV